MGEPSTFSIVNVTGNEKMSLKLRARALPYKPFTVEGSMRADITWYPGNAVGSIQMMGAEEKPSSVNGMWKDRFIKSVTDEGGLVNPTGIALYNEQQVADVRALANAVERIRLAGQLLRVEWGNIVREGILSRFRQTWHREEDLEWEMEFIWNSRGEQQAPVTLPLSPSPDSFAKQLRAGLDALKNALTPPEFPVLEEFSAAIDTAVQEIDDAVLEVENAVKNTVSQITSPLDAAERALAATETIATAASSIVTTCASFPPVAIVKTQNILTLGLSDALVASNYMREIAEEAKDIQLTASDQANTLRTTARQETLLASFVARAPIDLRDVSQKYYGTPDEWRRLLQYNDFESSEVAAGDLVLVPKITFADGRV